MSECEIAAAVVVNGVVGVSDAGKANVGEAVPAVGDALVGDKDAGNAVGPAVGGCVKGLVVGAADTVGLAVGAEVATTTDTAVISPYKLPIELNTPAGDDASNAANAEAAAASDPNPTTESTNTLPFEIPSTTTAAAATPAAVLMSATKAARNAASNCGSTKLTMSRSPNITDDTTLTDELVGAPVGDAAVGDLVGTPVGEPVA